MWKYTRRTFLQGLGKLAALGNIGYGPGNWLRAELLRTGSPGESALAMPETFQTLKDGWATPTRTYKPHTRWWWPGNAVTKDGIRWELEEMHAQGVGGVEIMSPWEMYARGNTPYLSAQYMEMVKYTVQQAERLDMEVAITFGAGWRFGGSWVPPTQRSKVLGQVFIDISGPASFDQELPRYIPRSSQHLSSTFQSDAPDENQMVAVVAGKVAGERLDAHSLVDLTARVDKNHMQWSVPDGKWRVMVFRLKYTGEQNATTENYPQRYWVVDHFNKAAVQSYCDYLGGAFYQAVGSQFGKTVDTLFCDSFEISVFPDTIHWSNEALDQFRAYKGYDLKRYLPAIWWDIGEMTPKVRYDVNSFLGWLALDAFFAPFIGWSEKHHIQARIQPYYRFTEELIQGAGATPRPEMEVTTVRFEVVADPRKSVAAGAHLYNRKIVSAEAYTFTHQERYRTTLEEMKVATDAFLRDGVTQFYNHGYLYSPEMHVAPSRDVPFANRISHWNTWWQYYHHLTAYVSRCSFLLRQGEFVGDVLLYSPQATVWTEKVLFGDERRVMPYGDLAKTLVANGYDFDPVNDDVLQNRARIEDGLVKVRDLAYRFVILPNTTAVPLSTMDFLRKYVLGGGILIALEELPQTSVGLNNSAQEDVRVREIVVELFGSDGSGKSHPGGGDTYHIGGYQIPGYEFSNSHFNPGSHPYEPTPPLNPPQQALLKAMRRHLPPDFGLAGNEQSDGLTCLHRRLTSGDDIYFVTNLQPQAVRKAINFRVTDKVPTEWNPMTAKTRPIALYRPRGSTVEIPFNLPAYASTCLIFKAGAADLYVSDTNLDAVLEANTQEIKGIVTQNGTARATVVSNGKSRDVEIGVSDIPQPYEISGTWKMVLEGYRFPKLSKTISSLDSWTADPQTQHFSGTGHYDLDFELPAGYPLEKIEWILDLGSVGNVAEVLLNGRSVGVAWMRPYQLPVTEGLRSGTNHLTVLVTNTLINYVAGMNKLPEVPQDLIAHYGGTAPHYNEGAEQWEKREKDFHPLPPSGLMGPIQLIPRRRVTLPLNVL